MLNLTRCRRRERTVKGEGRRWKEKGGKLWLLHWLWLAAG